MSHTPWQRDALVRGDDDSGLERGSDSRRSVAHYREALHAARLALLVSLLALGIAFIGAIVSLISLCYSLR